MAHTFSNFSGVEDEPVKSVKMKVETSRILWRIPHESSFALCSLQFSVCSPGLCYVSLCGTQKKTRNSTNMRFRLSKQWQREAWGYF